MDYPLGVERLNPVASEGEDINRVGQIQPPSPPQKQEPAMKNFVLAAIAVLTIGVGSAFAAQTVTNHLGQVIDGPAYSSDAAGG
jgi:hypothetical protein